MDKIDKKNLKAIEKLADDFFSLLGIKANIAIKAESDTINIDVSGDDLGILIGFHGETLEALQLLLNLMVNKHLGRQEWVHVILDVGGWRQEREDALRKLLEEAVQRAQDTQESTSLPALSAPQRRFVHVLLQEYPSLESHSEGEEPDRHIIISPKS